MALCFERDKLYPDSRVRVTRPGLFKEHFAGKSNVKFDLDNMWLQFLKLKPSVIALTERSTGDEFKWMRHKVCTGIYENMYALMLIFRYVSKVGKEKGGRNLESKRCWDLKDQTNRIKCSSFEIFQLVFVDLKLLLRGMKPTWCHVNSQNFIKQTRVVWGTLQMDSRMIDSF